MKVININVTWRPEDVEIPSLVHKIYFEDESLCNSGYFTRGSDGHVAIMFTPHVYELLTGKKKGIFWV